MYEKEKIMAELEKVKNIPKVSTRLVSNEVLQRLEKN
jgi:hypothetical protein